MGPMDGPNAGAPHAGKPHADGRPVPPVRDLLDMERFRSMLLNCPDMISIHTLGGRYVYASPAAVDIIGHDPRDLVDQDAYTFFHPEDLEEIQKSHDTILDGTDTYRVRYRILHADGSWVWVETTSRTMRNAVTGAPEEIVALTRRVEPGPAGTLPAEEDSPLGRL